MSSKMKQLGALSLTPHQEIRMPKVKDDRPAYMVSGKGFFTSKDKFLYPGQATYLDEEPNLDLIPLNKIAYDRIQQFLDKLDEMGERKAKKEGRAYVRQPRQVWNEDGVQDELPTPKFAMAAPKDGPDDTIR